MAMTARASLLGLVIAMIAIAGGSASVVLAQSATSDAGSGSGSGSGSGPTAQLEVAVKATYLYKLAPFIDWPAGNAAQPFTICVVGSDPFGAILDQAVAGQAFGARPYLIARVDTIGAGSTCNVAYIGGSASQSVANALQAVHGRPVLTVTDANDPSGIVDFAVQDGRVRFRIDQRAATENGLTISSKLLNLALSVKGGIRP